MDQKQLQKRNDLLAQISALKASISGLELTGNKDYKDLIQGNKDALKLVEDEFVKFEKKVEQDKAKEVKRRQAARQKEILDEFEFIRQFMEHLGTLKSDALPEDEMLKTFKVIKRKPHVIKRLRTLGF